MEQGVAGTLDILVLTVFLVVYFGMFLGELPGLALDRTGVALLGAIVILACGRLETRDLASAVDMPTLALLLGLMIISAQFRLSGFYTWVVRRVDAWDGPPPLLLALMLIVAAVLSAVLANDIVCLAMTPVLIACCVRRGSCLAVGRRRVTPAVHPCWGSPSSAIMRPAGGWRSGGTPTVFGESCAPSREALGARRLDPSHPTPELSCDRAVVPSRADGKDQRC